MPRIDPLQLLTCLSVLLSPDGGILSCDEVPRLVNLMTKFSKKLVSKCVYILILKNTEQSLVNLFMAEGGWNLIHTWLQDAIHISNWDLVKEILSLLLITPVDVERLKSNNIPKLVKSLTRLDEVKGVQDLSTQLVHDWLAIVKGNTKIEEVPKTQPTQEPEKTENVEVAETVAVCEINNETVDSSQINASDDAENQVIPTNTFYKVTVRDGKQVISRTASVDSFTEETATAELAAEPVDYVDTKKEAKEKKSDDKNKTNDKSKSKSRSSSSKHGSNSSSSNRSKSSSSSSKDRHKSSSSSSSRSSSRDKEREKEKRDRHKANGVKSSSSSSHKDKSDQKEKQAERDKDTLAKIKPQSIDKLGRIPKKTDDKTEKEVKKPTMSIEVRKNSEDRPKTVKVFNSKRRSTGLEEEAKPPPPRPAKKPAVTLPSIPQKRVSPVKDLPTPPEKKFKIEIPERPGAIKLIPPKPKPPVLQESDIFMDALAASATSKKEPKKRKRRPSVSKETPGSPTTPQEPQTPTSPVTSPIGLKNIAAPNFYQDTLQAEPTTDDVKEGPQEENTERSGTPIESEAEKPKAADGALKGALMYTKKKGPKKSVKFNDNNLTQIRYFELDETERVNVTRNFMDMAKMEMTSEREALQLSRKLPNEDVMEPQTMWRLPFVIDQKEPLAVPGCKSLEKDIQFAREKSVLQALYFDKRKIPDSPEEPIPENHQISDPIIIPLEDSESQEMDLRNTPWPEPKGSPPPMQENLPPQIFTNMPMPFQNFPHAAPSAFQGMPPRFGPQNGPGVFGGPPNIMPNGNLMGPPNMGPPPDMIHPGPLNPAAFGPGPDNFNNPMMNDNNFQMPFNPPNMGMFPPNNFNMNRGGGRGGFRRGGNNNGPWIRMNGPGPGSWNNRGGGGGRGGRLCKNVKNHGFCRNRDNCPFIHPK